MRRVFVAITCGLLTVAAQAHAGCGTGDCGGYAGTSYGFGAGCGGANCDFANSLWDGYCSEPTCGMGCGPLGRGGWCRGFFGGGGACCGSGTWFGCGQACGFGSGIGCGIGFGDRCRHFGAFRCWRGGLGLSGCAAPCDGCSDCGCDFGSTMDTGCCHGSSGCGNDSAVGTPVHEGQPHPAEGAPMESSDWNQMEGASYPMQDSNIHNIEAPSGNNGMNNGPFYQSPQPLVPQGQPRNSEGNRGAPAEQLPSTGQGVSFEDA